MRNITVFLVWQADNKSARNRLTKALEQAAEKLTTGDITVAVDQDTDSTTGSQTIDHVILQRIASADVVVADVTPVGTTTDGTKILPNANVMFEVGYAFSSVGPERVILVRDTDKGLSGDMPFDIRNRETLHFASPAALRDELLSKIARIIQQGPELPGSLEDRAAIVRLMVDKRSPDVRGQLSGELALLASSADDVWAKAADYFDAPAPTGWKEDWLYGAKPEIELRSDIRLALLPSTSADVRSDATSRIAAYLDGVARWAARADAIQQTTKAKWLPPQGFGGGGSYRSPANLKAAAAWIGHAEAFGFKTWQARNALDALRADSSVDAHRGLATSVGQIVKQMREDDPCDPESGDIDVAETA